MTSPFLPPIPIPEPRVPTTDQDGRSLPELLRIISESQLNRLANIGLSTPVSTSRPFRREGFSGVLSSMPGPDERDIMNRVLWDETQNWRIRPELQEIHGSSGQGFSDRQSAVPFLGRFTPDTLDAYMSRSPEYRALSLKERNVFINSQWAQRRMLGAPQKWDISELDPHHDQLLEIISALPVPIAGATRAVLLAQAARAGTAAGVRTGGSAVALRGLQASAAIPAAALKPIAALEINPLMPVTFVTRSAKRFVQTNIGAFRGKQTIIGMPMMYGTVPGLTPVTTAINQVQPSTIAKEWAEQIGMSPQLRGKIYWFNRNLVADFSAPQEQIRILLTRTVKEAQGHAQQLTSRVLAVGDPDDLFKINSNGMMTAPNFKVPVSKNIVLEHPGRFNLTGPQQAVLETIYKSFDDIFTMLKAEGVELPRIKAGREFFPRYFKKIGDFEPTKGKMQALGRVRPFKGKPTSAHERAFDNILQLKDLRSGPSITADITEYFSGMYQLAIEKRVGNIVKTYSKTLKARYTEATILTLEKTVKRANDLTRVRQTLTTRMNIPIADPLRGPWVGRDALLREAPELVLRMEENIPYAVIADVAVRKKFMKDILNQVIKLEQVAKQDRKIALRAVQIMKKNARKRFGETQLSPMALKGQILTPQELVERLRPYMNLDDMSYLPQKDIDELSRLFSLKENPYFRGMKTGNSAVVTMTAAWDWGVGQIHGAPLFATAPAVWMRASKNSLHAMFKKGYIHEELARHNNTVIKMDSQNALGRGISDFVQSSQPGGLLHAATVGFERHVPIPGLRSMPRLVLEAFERQFSGFITLGKVYLWEAMEPMAIRQGGPTGLQDLAVHSSKMLSSMDITSIGMWPTFEQFVQSVPMFAAQYRLAVAGLIMDIARGGMRGELARDSMAKMVAAGVIFHVALAKGLGQEPNLDPRQPGKLLTVEIFNHRVGPSTAFMAAQRMLLNTTMQVAKEGPEAAFSIWNYDSKLGRAIRYGTSPFVGLGWDIFTGRSAMGEDIDNLGDVIDQLPDYILPFYASAQFDNPRPGWTGTGATFAGLNAYPLGEWDRFKQAVEHMAGTEFENLSNVEIDNLVLEHEELRVLQDRADGFWAAHGLDRDVREWRKKSDSATNIYNTMLEEASTSYQVTGKAIEFRKGVQDAGAYLRGSYRQRQDEMPEFAKKIEEFTLDEDAKMLDIAREEYMTTVVLGMFETRDENNQLTGEYNYTSRREAERRFIDKWGPTNYEAVKASLQGNKIYPPEVQELNRAKEALKPYWELGERILQKTDRGDLLESEGDKKSIWAEYISNRIYPDRRAAMEADYPYLRTVYRAQTRARELMRRRDPEIERILLRWEYVFSPLHPDNMAIPLDEIRRTPKY
jgi:hypothetical protein